ncbi:MAG: zinc ribbon domain-containing protein [Lachnospiraceae bacterium]|nr:zinc ribbon domain-containing protein [Candidatus Colinaster scatohippi]
MGFLDDISRTITDASQGALQKGKDFADTAKYNSLIADEERQLANLYQQIGRMYFEENMDSATGNYVNLVEGVKAANGRIADYRQRIQVLKGNPRCTNCGSELPSGSAFCAVCGNRVMPMPMPMPMHMQPEPMAPMPISCPECGAMIPPGNRFCTSCGQSIDQPMGNGMMQF